MQTWGTKWFSTIQVSSPDRKKRPECKERQQRDVDTEQHKKLELLIRGNIEIGSPDGHRRS